MILHLCGPLHENPLDPAGLRASHSILQPSNLSLPSCLSQEVARSSGILSFLFACASRVHLCSWATHCKPFDLVLQQAR